MRLSVVLPAHDEAGNVAEILDALRRVLEPLDGEWEAIFVDDGSTDGTWEILRDLASGDPRVRAVRLSRNFGHQVALSAGLSLAEGDAVITMDSDLQHPPSVIPELLARGAEGYDVVYAVRSSVDTESRFKRWSSDVFYRLLNRLTGLDLPHGGADFRYMSRRVVDVLRGMPERKRFLRGMTRWVGYRQTAVEYDRGPRRQGATKYTFRRMVSFALDAIVSFSALPLRIASVLGFVVSFLGGLYFLYIVAARIFAHRVVPGWTSVIIAVLVLGGAQLTALGIIGQYLGQMYEESKGRPLFLIAEDTRAAAASGMLGGDADDRADEDVPTPPLAGFPHR